MNRLDRAFEQMMKEGQTSADYISTQSVTPALAMSKLRATHNARAYNRVPDLLRDVIRANRLKEVGFAISSRIADTNKEEINALTLVHGSTIVAQSKNIAVAPTISTPIHLLDALVSTILPSLIDRPTAMVQWMSLVRTMIEIERECGDWTRALLFMKQHLHEIVPVGAPLDEINTAHVRNIIDARPSAPSAYASNRQQNSSYSINNASSSAPHRASAPTSSSSRNVCRDFNRGACVRDPCYYTHTCRYHLEGKDCDGKHPGFKCVHHIPSSSTSTASYASAYTSRRDRHIPSSASTVASSKQ